MSEKRTNFDVTSYNKTSQKHQSPGEKQTALGVTPFGKTPQERQSPGEKRVFTGVIAHCQLMLDKGGAVFDVLFAPQATPILVGRTSQQTEPAINIDLTAFNAVNLGVSRTHARFERSGSRLFVRDLNSSNGTWVNGKRIVPMNVHEIHHGNKIEFGRLSTTLYIKS